MGATISVGKAVAAFINSNDITVYAMYELQFEKNVYPHEPRWSCVFIGVFDDAITKVCGLAAECIDGLRQSRSGYIKPEAYFNAWRKLFAAPFGFGEMVINLQTGRAYSTSIPESASDSVEKVFIAHRREDLIPALRQAGVDLSWKDDTELLLGLYGSEGVLPPWRALQYCDTLSLPRAELGVSVRVPHAVVSLPALNVLRLAEDERTLANGMLLARFGDGKWQLYRDKAHFLAHHLVNNIRPRLTLGSSRQLERMMEEARICCETAPAVPESAFVVVSIRHGGPKTEDTQFAIQKLAASVGRINADGSLPAEMKLGLADFERHEWDLSWLSSIPEEMVDWFINEASVV
jgi:hypothetical protein